MIHVILITFQKLLQYLRLLVYENSDNSVDEASTAKPLSPYGQSKLDMENIIIQSKIDYVILRLFNVYGNGQTSWSNYKF